VSEETGPPVVRRIVLGLHPSPHGRAALDAAARLASFLGLELRGVYVQEERLMRLPGVLREVDAVSGRVRRLDSSGLERQIRAEAARAHQELSQVAGRLRLRWTFQSSRGEVATVVREAATSRDLVAVGVGTRTFGRALGSTARALLSVTELPVLVSRAGMHLGPHVHVVDDGTVSGAGAVQLARSLTERKGTRLTIHVAGKEGSGRRRAERYRGELRAAGRTGDVVRTAPGRGAAAPLAERDCGLVILPRTALGGDGAELERILRHSASPVLVV